MNFKEFNRDQALLLPPRFKQFLGESHEAVVLAEFMDDLDLASLEDAYGNDHGGRRAYHPVMLLSVLIYGYMSGTFSSRKIAKCLRQDLAFMYLAGNDTPDFRTLSRFRKEKGVSLQAVFKKVVDKAHELGFVSFGTVSLDGTKIRASASKDKNETRDALQEKIRLLVQEAGRVDEIEDGLYGDREDAEDPDLKTKEGRAKKKRGLQEKRDRSEAHLKALAARPAAASSKEAKINTTDPDARFMKMKRGDFANGYNVQVTTENGFVLSSHVADSPADQPLLIPSLLSMKDLHGVMPERLLADKGYSSEGNYAFCEQERIDAYIPPQRTSVDMTRYAYDQESDTYADDLGRIFRFKQRMRKNRTTKYVHLDTATRKRKYLSVSLGWQRYAQEQKRKLSTQQGKQTYSQRMYDVEGAFANIKHNLGFTAFRLRGFTGVRNEWSLISLAHNLTKML